MIYTDIDNFYLTNEEIESSPSRQDGIDLETESTLRIYGCELIQEVGILLKCPQAVMATGQVMFHRFYCRQSMKHYHVKRVAAACFWLATKLEETPRKTMEVILVFDRIIKRRESRKLTIMDPYSKEYEDFKASMKRNERIILKTFGFIVHVEHPHKFVLSYLHVLEGNEQLMQEAWNCLNDSLRTTLCVRFKAEVVACGAIFYAARKLQIPLPENPPWWEVFSCRTDQLVDVVLALHDLYSRPKVHYIHVHKDPLAAPPRALAESGSSPALQEGSSIALLAEQEPAAAAAEVAAVVAEEQPAASAQAATATGREDGVTNGGGAPSGAAEPSGGSFADSERRKHRHRDRDRDRDRERERSRPLNDGGEPRDRDRDRDRALGRDRDGDRDRDRDRGADRDRGGGDRDKSRGDRDRVRERGVEKEREARSDREYPGDRDRDRDRDRERERERYRDRDRDKERERERERERGREREREKEKDRPRERERGEEERVRLERVPAKVEKEKEHSRDPGVRGREAAGTEVAETEGSVPRWEVEAAPEVDNGEMDVDDGDVQMEQALKKGEPSMGMTDPDLPPHLKEDGPKESSQAQHESPQTKRRKS